MKLLNFRYLALVLLLLPARLFPQSDKLLPAHCQIQYAGGMGFVSAGIGWEYCKHWETDVFFGYLPRYSTKEAKGTFTLKENYIPWTKKMKGNYKIAPLTCGMYINSVLDDDFWISAPDKYPNMYYSFSTKLRFHFYVGQRVTYMMPPEKCSRIKSISVFYELSSNDLYVLSAIQNERLNLFDILRFSFGVKLGFVN
ncbi:MAG: hypothetical protein LBR06_07955 [Bacteroidales bacterium]|jgi:hypothetical protein|nr:hypothetical protein [Bacteroidales bacterium]